MTNKDIKKLVRRLEKAKAHICGNCNLDDLDVINTEGYNKGLDLAINYVKDLLEPEEKDEDEEEE